MYNSFDSTMEQQELIFDMELPELHISDNDFMKQNLKNDEDDDDEDDDADSDEETAAINSIIKPGNFSMDAENKNEAGPSKPLKKPRKKKQPFEKLPHLLLSYSYMINSKELRYGFWSTTLEPVFLIADERRRFIEMNGNEFHEFFRSPLVSYWMNEAPTSHLALPKQNNLAGNTTLQLKITKKNDSKIVALSKNLPDNRRIRIAFDVEELKILLSLRDFIESRKTLMEIDQPRIARFLDWFISTCKSAKTTFLTPAQFVLPEDGSAHLDYFRLFYDIQCFMQARLECEIFDHEMEIFLQNA